MKQINWGIIGCGNIANRFALDIKFVENAKLIACSSKDEKKAKDFKEKYDLEFCYSNYEQMLKNPQINSVYIATTHNFHYENALLCIEYDKHILCEKSFTINSKQAKEVFEKAKKKNLFVMEAMWTRFLPATRWVKEQIKNGAIGQVISVFAQFGFKFPFDENSRLYDINLAGGGLLDLGIYPLSFACNILGNRPQKIIGVAKMGKTGVDEQASISLIYKDGQTATLTYSMLINYECSAEIYGTKGKILLNHTCYPTKATLFKENGETDDFDGSFSNNFEYEIREATNLILQGKLESPIISSNDTIEIMELCDNLRQQWDFKYPQEMN